MGLDSRRDSEFANSIRGDMLAERLDNFAKVGPLLNDKVVAALEFKIQDETRLPAGIVKDIVETMNSTIGKGVSSPQEQTRDQTMSEIKEAFGDRVTNPKFLERIASEIVQIVDTSLKDRETRVGGLKLAPVTPAISAPSVAAPSMGVGGKR